MPTPSSRPKILITGGAGFIGSHVVDKFIARGFAVVVVDNFSAGRRENLNPGAVLYEVDITHPQALAEVFAREKPDYVSHHAAQVNVRYSVDNPLADAQTNILGSINVLECARLFGVRQVIYISSSGAVYGEPQYLPCDENHPIVPMSPYGASKHTVEHYVHMYYQNYGLRYTVLRYPNVFGPRQSPEGEAGVVSVFIVRMLRHQSVIINGDGEQQRDFLYVADCAEANWLALNQQVVGMYNLGTGHATSINELFRLLQARTGYAQPAMHGPAKTGEILRSYVTAERATAALGWSPSVPFAQGLDHTLDYFRQTFAE
jgi:UDP-glucose 4-epimerase